MHTGTLALSAYIANDHARESFWGCDEKVGDGKEMTRRRTTGIERRVDVHVRLGPRVEQASCLLALDEWEGQQDATLPLQGKGMDGAGLLAVPPTRFLELDRKEVDAVGFAGDDIAGCVLCAGAVFGGGPRVDEIQRIFGAGELD